MADLGFVRTEMLPEKAPPPSTVGIIGWLRANLFSNITNSILTLLALYFVYYILASILPWIFVPTWSGASVNECRELIAASGHGGAHGGACWGVIRERWIQLLFGFYPSELYWRPILAFILMGVALAPVLFSELPRKLLWFSAVYPFLMVWLLWGGSAWIFIMIIAGFGFGALVWSLLSSESLPQPVRMVLGAIAGLIVAAVIYSLFSFATSVSWGFVQSTLGSFGAAGIIGKILLILVLLVLVPMLVISALVMSLGALAAIPLIFLGVKGNNTLAKVLTTMVMMLLWWVVTTAGVSSVGIPAIADVAHSIIPIGLEAVPSSNFGGFMLSITIGVTGIVLSLPLGVLLALGRQSDLIVLKSVCVIFIEFIRGVPLITLLFVASTLLNLFLPPGTNFDIILRVIIMVTLFASAYMAEVIRGGLAALPKGQYEAADSLGLDYFKAQRLIIMPQALKISIPGIVSTFIGLFKDTVLVSIIGLLDPIGLKQTINGAPNAVWSGLNWEIYGFVSVIFFIFCFGMSRYSMYLERKLATDHR